MKGFALTTRGFLVLITLVVGLMVALWSGNATLEMLWRAAAMLYVAAIVLEWLKQKQVTTEGHIVAGTEVTLGKSDQLQIEVTTSQPASFRCYLPGTDELEVYRQKLIENRLFCEVMPHQSGQLNPGSLHVRINGMFNLSSWDHAVELHDSIQVKLDHTTSSMALNSDNVKQRYADKVMGQGFELDRLRDYRHGDSVRMIDWKATARRRKKTVRQFTDENQQEVCILLDASHYGRVEVDGVSRFTYMLNTVARLSNLANRSGDQVSFCSYGSTTKAVVPPGSSHHHHQKILETLNGIDIDEGPANHLMGYMNASTQLKRRSLLIFVTHLDHASSTDHLAQTIALASRKHLVITVSIRDHELDSLIAVEPIRWQDPFNALAATQIKEATELLISQLQRRGTYVLHARKETVDRDLITTYQRIRERRLVS